MKKTLLIAAAATLGFASSAFAVPAVGSATGTVNVSGTVTAKCADTGTNPVSIDLGELANSSGTVVSSFAGTTHANLTFACTSAKPTVSVAATPLTGPASPPSGYTNLVQYRATVTAYLAGGAANAAQPVVYTDATASTTSVILTSQLNNAADNVQVDIDHPTSNGNLLVASSAGGYTGAVTVTVAPTN